MNKINTNKAPAAIGPYSQAMEANGFIFTSGQIPLDLQGNIVGSDIEGQAHQALKNLGEVLKEAGSSYENVLKTTCFLKDMGDFSKFNEVYAQYFKGDCPARSCVAVKTLPKDLLCEVEAIAVKKQ